MGSSSPKDLRSHKTLPMMGKLIGPGGRVAVPVSFPAVGSRKTMLSMDFRRKETQRETAIKNHVSIAKDQGMFLLMKVSTFTLPTQTDEFYLSDYHLKYYRLHCKNKQDDASTTY